MTTLNLKTSIQSVHDEETDTLYYLTDDVYQYYFTSRGHIPERDPSEYAKVLQAQSQVIVREYSLLRNRLWPVTSVNELLIIMGDQPESWAEQSISYKKCAYRGVTYFIEGQVWSTHFGGDDVYVETLNENDLMSHAVFAYRQDSVVKCAFSCKLGSWDAIFERLDDIAEPVVLQGHEQLVDVRPYQESYTLSEVQALLDENASLKKEVEHFKRAQVWYVNALEVLSPLRYHGHQLLEAPDRTSLQDALKLMIDKAENFFTKRDKNSGTK